VITATELNTDSGCHLRVLVRYCWLRATMQKLD
jgi:hypothetical protein